MNLPMTDEELKKRIRNGTPIKILAELNGVSDQTIYNWMKKNGVERPKDEPEKETAQVVAKVVPVEIKIEVDDNTYREVNAHISSMEQRIKSLKNDIKFYEEQIESWKKILAVLTQKEALPND